MANEQGPNLPGGGNGGDRMKAIKKAIAEILDREAVKSLKNKMAKQLRARIATNTEEMEEIDSKTLQKKFLKEVFEKGNYNLTEEEANLITTEKAEWFINLRESMSDGERYNYVESATAVHREETNKKFNRRWEEGILKRDKLDMGTIRRKNRGDAGQEDPLADPEDEQY